MNALASLGEEEYKMLDYDSGKTVENLLYCINLALQYLCACAFLSFRTDLTSQM